MRWEDLDKQPCSLARTLSVVGDRWTMMVLRECFLGLRRFDGIEKRLGITRHVLADRLKKLVENGVLYKAPYQQKPVREEYRLTEKGLELHPVMLALVHWGDKHMVGERGGPIVHIHRKCGQAMQPVTVCSCCGEPVTARDIRVEASPHWQDLSKELLP
ncbi:MULTISPECIES: helix-turn-helix domain-containing protein [unclassified Marinobacter]|uniref:winged helix-turn-helix transcriptional regulator n=1 Tax=unclassified Marinobacter TaxID=83889 RepID=UPI00200D1F24|nr:MULTISPECIES: helix-turn-helix domain-containing protein [unclassified Marinobacter]MCL1484216.1 helix-turn-helix transcriptional regulator [Marinobacter sp.]UQG57783.1 helix-turn-helix transcriptional regulator [Marinobacter sp. M4C]UQG66588.1 helix-turn-helix transcriptional regulator [Marinobacter sp. M2C]UQG70868.1 helix-turn-helix transcriptional regulator [Marinobacter sp. M1C]